MGEVPIKFSDNLGNLLYEWFACTINFLPLFQCNNLPQQDIDLDQDLDHYDMKEEEPPEGKKSEDDGIEKENLAILEKIRKNQRQDHLNVNTFSVLINVCLYLYSELTVPTHYSFFGLIFQNYTL